MDSSIIPLMLNLYTKGSSINVDDQEYNKMKERILIINKNSLTDDIFYEQRFNVNNNDFFFFFNFHFDILLDVRYYS